MYYYYQNLLIKQGLDRMPANRKQLTRGNAGKIPRYAGLPAWRHWRQTWCRGAEQTHVNNRDRHGTRRFSCFDRLPDGFLRWRCNKLVVGTHVHEERIGHGNFYFSSAATAKLAESMNRPKLTRRETEVLHVLAQLQSEIPS